MCIRDRVLIDLRHFQGIHCGRPNCLPWSEILDTANSKVIPVYPIYTWQRHLKLSINQNQHLLKFVRILSSLYSEEVQFADCLKVHPPKKKKRYFHALPLVALPPLANYLHINHNSFTSFKMYILSYIKHKPWMRRYFGFKSMLPQMGAPMARATVKTFPCPALMYA